MLKKLLVASTVLGVAVLLQNKERRDRLVSSARDLLTAAREKLEKVEKKELERSSVRSDSTFGAGATTRHTAPPPALSPPRSGTW